MDDDTLKHKQYLVLYPGLGRIIILIRLNLVTFINLSTACIADGTIVKANRDKRQFICLTCIYKNSSFGYVYIIMI